MTIADDPDPDPDPLLRHELQQLPDAPMPDALWPRVNAARGRRFHRRRIGLAAAAVVAAVAVVSLPWPPPPGNAPAPAHATVASVLPATQSSPVDTTTQLRALDRALQAGYERNASDAELASLWAARARLVSDQDAPLPAANIQRI